MQNPSLTPNLTGITLSAAERQMGPISGGPINFAFARLRHASLRFATLSGANLEMADLTDADYAHMRKVIGYVARHSKQRPEGDISETPWRYSLMNWGNDPQKKK